MPQKRKDRRQQAVDDPKEELRLQEYIFLWTFLLMVLLLVSLYLQINPIVPAAAGVVLVVSTIALYVKYREFYAVRDRGQRTWCSVLSMYASLLLTLGCAYYYSQHERLTDEYALVFLFGFLFFTYMAYRTLSRSMVVGNKRVRVKR
mgnify:FL=1|jgi:hypothetical protein